MINRLFAIFLGLVVRIHKNTYSRQPFYLFYTAFPDYDDLQKEHSARGK